MTLQTGVLPVSFAVTMLALSFSPAAEPPETPSTPATETTAATPAKLLATNVVMGKVEKVSPTSLTLKVTSQMITPGKVKPAHIAPAEYVPAHLTGGLFPKVVPAHWTQPHAVPAHATHPQVHNVTQSVTYEFVETPPVKTGAASSATRVTGSYADVKPGETVKIGLGPMKDKGAEGKTITRTVVTGIDVMTAIPDTSTKTTKK
jgi:hypothetical protein